MGDDVRTRAWSAAACTATLLVLFPTAAQAEQPVTPAGTGGGCRENGQVVASNAKGLQPFGTVVRANAPIAPLNAAFFVKHCD